MIDKNGRLFGKVSIIDVLIVTLVLAAGFFFAARYLSSRDNPINVGGSLDDLEIKFYSEEVNNFVVDSIKEGDSAKEFAQYANFGTVVKVEKADSITWVADFDGLINPSSKDGYYSSVTVTTRARGKIGAIGFELDGSTYFVGKTVIMQFGLAGFQGRIAGVSKVSDLEGADADAAAEPGRGDIKGDRDFEDQIDRPSRDDGLDGQDLDNGLDIPSLDNGLDGENNGPNKKYSSVAESVNAVSGDAAR